MQPPFDAAPLPTGARVVSIDRFEGDMAVLAVPDDTHKTGERFVDVPRSTLPTASKEGDILVQYPDGSYQIDHARTAQRRAATKARVEALFHKPQ